MGISVGIVGVGSFGPQFIKLFKVHPNVDRLALCDLKPDRLSHCSKEYQVSETYSSLDDICKSDLDALAIFSNLRGDGSDVLKKIGKGSNSLAEPG